MSGTDQFASGIPGKYQIERLLGQSELGSAYLVYQPAQKRQVMVTTFNLPAGMTAPDYGQLRQRLSREEGALARLTHPHIVPVYSLGIQPRYLYLATAFVKEASLGHYLKRNVRFTPEQTLGMLKQLAAGLEYAHSQGVTHGMLSLANVMVNSELNMRLAGFGLRSMLEVHGGAQDSRPLAHLTSENGTFLGSAAYISPERVQGLAVDARSDIYSLGVMLFELLSGSKLFQGANSVDIALQRLRQTVPSIHVVCPEVPAAFDLVLRNMLERDPAKRTQYIGEAVIAFERILKTLNPEKWAVSAGGEQPMTGSAATLPPTVNWFDEPATASNQWETILPVQTTPVAGSASSARMPVQNAQEKSLAQAGPPAQSGENSYSLGGVDPFAWWTSTSTGLRSASAPAPTPGVFTRNAPTRLSNAQALLRKRPALQDRRTVVKSIVAGAAVVGTLTVVGITFEHFLQSVKQSQVATGGSASSIANIGGSTATDTTPGTQHGKTPTVQPTKGAQKSPTKQPAPTPVPGHTGTVIGSISQAMNSAIVFTNPATGVSSLLVRLANGNFEACERTCTHEPSPENLVNYVPGSQTLKCPTHGAVFNALSNFVHTSGPGGGSLTGITIRVNGDGTVTTG